MQTPIATSVAGIATQVSCRVPAQGRRALHVCVDHTRSRPGQKKAAYCDSPTAPDAIDSGALNESCQINRKETSRPNFCGPEISWRYRYEPPGPGIAAPSSAQTSPSQTARTAPSTQPSMACGPPITVTIRPID